MNGKPAIKLTKEQQVENYFKNSRLRFVDLKTQKLIKDTLLAQPNWPGIEAIKTAEQFYWNLRIDKDDLIKLVFAHPQNLNWQTFTAWAQPMLNSVRAEYRNKSLTNLVALYQTFPDAAQRDAFTAWVQPLLNDLDLNSRNNALANLATLYQTFPDASQRDAFTAWVQPLLNDLGFNYKTNAFANLAALYTDIPYIPQIDVFTALAYLYRAIPDAAQRDAFTAWAQPLFISDVFIYIGNDLANLATLYLAIPNSAQRDAFKAWAQPQLNKAKLYRGIALANLASLYKTFPDAAQRDAFTAWAQPKLNEIHPNRRSYELANLIALYQTFPDAAQRDAFTAWEQHMLDGLSPNNTYELANLIPVYQNTNDKESFDFFMNLHQHVREHYIRYPHFIRILINSFIPGTYLPYMRGLAALTAEHNSQTIRVQSIYETKLDSLLPAFCTDDPLMQRQVATAGFANVHEFDAIYPTEFELLKQKVADMGYQEQPSASTYTIHNEELTIEAHKTNKTVEEFIRYLDSEFANIQESISVNGKKLSSSDAVSLVKQILGLEPKSRTTKVVFAPYLGASMLYANPDSPKGDEVLGRVWFLMNNIISERFINDVTASSDEKKLQVMREDRNTHRRSVVLAILEAAEINGEVAHINCQTRMTGELLKLACWHTGAESKLRKLIAFDDSLEVETESDIQLRIDVAPMKAKNIFESMKRGEAPAVRALWEKHNESKTPPDLYEYYLVYYDGLYRRTTVLGPDGNPEFGPNGMLKYKKDEHILERDNLGNLVSRYNADGSLRRNTAGAEETEIVYYQAEFAIIEHEFTKLLKAEFQDQRGILYQ